MRRNKLIATFFCLLMIGFFSYCQKREVDYVNYDATEKKEREENKNSDISEIFMSDNGTSYVEINAEIIKKTEILPVVTLSPAPFSKEDIQTFSDRIFDSGSLEGETEYVYETTKYEKMLDQNDPLTGRPMFKMIEYETGTCNLQGSIDGKKEYELSFYQYEDYTRMIFTAPDVQDFYTGMDVGNERQNICKYSKDEAVILATDFLKKLGIEGFEPVRVLYATQNKENEENVDVNMPNAYYIAFGRSINGADILYSTEYFLLNEIGFRDEAEEIEQEACHEWISMYINNDGVVKMTYQAPEKINEIITSEAVLLPFESILDRAEEYFRESYLNVNDEFTLTIQEIELGLTEAIGEDGSVMLVPAWGFYSVDDISPEYSRTCLLMINAIDGSRIYY